MSATPAATAPHGRHAFASAITLRRAAEAHPHVILTLLGPNGGIVSTAALDRAETAALITRLSKALAELPPLPAARA